MFKALCVAAVFALGAGSASAAVMQAVYTGTVYGGFDGPGYFGVANSDLTDLDYVLTFKYDTELGEQYLVDNPFQRSVSLYPSGAGNPMLSATVRIRGVTLEIVRDATLPGGRVDIVNGQGCRDLNIAPCTDFAEHIASQDLSLIQGYQKRILQAFHGADAPYPLDLSIPYVVGESLAVRAFPTLFFQTIVNGLEVERTDVSFEVNGLTVTRLDSGPAPIPLPAALPLLALGLGWLAALRRRAA